MSSIRPHPDLIENLETIRPGKTRSTVSSAPLVVGVFVAAGLTVDRVLLFVLLALLVTGCEQRPSPAPDAGLAASGPSATSSAPAFPPKSCKNKCKLAGLCKWDGQRGRCVAVDTKDCMAATVCKTSGNCEAAHSECIVGKPEHCQKAERCKSEGLCNYTRRGVRCSATEETCKAADICRRKGRCSPFRGKCDVTDSDDCAQSELCKKHGQCTATPRKGSRVAVFTCKAANNDDCNKSEDCTERGLCTAANGYCR